MNKKARGTSVTGADAVKTKQRTSEPRLAMPKGAKPAPKDPTHGSPNTGSAVHATPEDAARQAPTESETDKVHLAPPATRRGILLNVRLAFPEPNSTEIGPDNSWLLPAVSTNKLFEVLAFGEEGVKDPSLGTLFPNLSPREDGTFLLELGVLLPDRLPTLNGKTEYWIDLAEGEDNYRICFSNQMCRLLFKGKGEAYEAIAPRAALAAKKVVESLPPELLGVPAEPLATVATVRFPIPGGSAEDALERNLYPCAEHFVRLLNRVVAANIALQLDASPAIVAEYELNTFGTMFFAIEGTKRSQLGHGKFATNLHRSVLNPRNLSLDDASRLLALATGAAQVSDVTLLLNSTRSLLAGGMVRQALLQLAIACETATRRYVHAALLASGSSKAKLESVEKDLTFSIMLNVILFSVAPVGMKPDRKIVADVDQVRKLRNTLMHEGTLKSNRDAINTLYESALRFVQYLRNIADSQGVQRP